jgi:hypothetical protein
VKMNFEHIEDILFGERFIADTHAHIRIFSSQRYQGRLTTKVSVIQKTLVL